MNRRAFVSLAGSTAGIAIAGPALAQSASPATAASLSAAQIDQLTAPIALYPDALLSQVLMAASYPMEVIEAARWSKANPTLRGDAALAAVKDKGWDVSVSSLVAFPQVLETMSSKLDWTQNLGDAMVAQQSDVAASIQRLRAQAQAAGNLKSTAQQTVTSQPPGADAPAGTPAAIVIQPTDPETVYVPSYNPASIYGVWPYPANPPTYFPPPAGYGFGAPLARGVAFGLGMAVGGAFFGSWRWGGGWGGGWGWRGWHGGGYTWIDIDRATRITNNFDRNVYRDGHWHHDASHRHGVPYRHPDRNGGHEGRDGHRGAYRGHDGHRDTGRGHAFSGVNHGGRVNHERARGHSYEHHAGHAAHHAGGGGHRGGGGGHRGGRR